MVPILTRSFVPSTVLLGVGMKLAATFFFALMLALGKAYSVYGVSEVVFFRSAFALIPVMIWLVMRGDFPRALRTSRFGGHMVRSVAGIGSMFCMFASYALLPLADATALGYAAPLMITLMAAYFLGETMTGLRWGAVAVGFAGVVVMLWEHLGSPAPDAPARSALGAGLALAGAFLVSIAMVQTRRLTKTEDTGAITFYFQSSTTIASGAVLAAAVFWPTNWPLASLMASQAWTTPSPMDWAPLIAIGLLGGIGQIFMTQGYRYADASILAVFDYSSLLFAIAIGYLAFSDVPTGQTLFGASIVICAGLAVVWQESRGRRRGALKPH
jgi:drug/metabolite transporter (DMT)-like permease